MTRPTSFKSRERNVTIAGVGPEILEVMLVFLSTQMTIMPFFGMMKVA